MQRVLKGEESGAVTLQGDQVVLDVDEVIKQVQERLVARGLTMVENVPIPETDRQIVLVEAAQVKQVRTIYAFANPVANGCFRSSVSSTSPRSSWPGAHDDGGDRSRGRSQRRLLALFLSIGRQLFVDELAGTGLARRAGSSTTPCSRISSEDKTCSSSSVWCS